MSNSVTTIGFKEFQDKLKKAPALIKKLVRLELSATARDWADLAKNSSPHNHGDLIGSVIPKDYDNRSEVTVNKEYAPFIEWGTKSKVSVPSELASYANQFRGKTQGGRARELIYQWCKDRGIPKDAWYLIYREIMINGIKPQPFFFKHKKAVETLLIQRIKKVVDGL